MNSKNNIVCIYRNLLDNIAPMAENYTPPTRPSYDSLVRDEKFLDAEAALNAYRSACLLQGFINGFRGSNDFSIEDEISSEASVVEKYNIDCASYREVCLRDGERIGKNFREALLSQ